jgi:hypothetical protein
VGSNTTVSPSGESIEAIKRCMGCPGSDPEDGPVLCDNPLEACLFRPKDQPHQFTLTVGPIKTSHKVMCPECGYIAPYEPLPDNSIALCVLCWMEFIIRKVK